MGASEFLIVLCSPNSARSQWVNREVAWFKINRDPKKILTLIVGGEPMASLIAGREGEECFPKTLLMKIGADLLPTEELEEAPLAADARETGDGKRGAKLKLAAAMLGVGLDILVNRDNRRRAERRRLIMTGMAASIAVLGGLTVFAFTQRDAAVAARKDAEFQRDEAQGLVEYMVTDLRKRLDAVGRLDVLESVGVRLADFYGKQDLAKLDPDALGRRARVQLLLGEVDNTRGHLDAALARYKEAAATTEELLKRNPGSAQQIFDHAQSVYWVGYIAWQRGDAKEAKKYFTQYKDYADRLGAIDPENEDWQMEVKYALNNLGTLAMDQGEAAEAERYFRKSLEIVTSLAEKHPDDIGRQISLGQSYAWLADSLHRQVKLDEARSARETEVKLYHAWLESRPNDADLLSALAVAQYRLAQIFLAAGKLDEAREAATAASNLADDQYGAAPDNTKAADQASIAHSLLGEIYFYLDRIPESRGSLAIAIEIASQLVARDHSVALWGGVTLAQAKLVLAKVAFVDSGKEVARELVGEVMISHRRLIGSGSNEPGIAWIYCEAIAEYARRSNEPEVEWRLVIQVLEPNITRQLPSAQALLAEAYIRTGATASARGIASRLDTAGYQHPDFLALLEEFPELKAAVVGHVAAQ